MLWVLGIGGKASIEMQGEEWAQTISYHTAAERCADVYPTSSTCALVSRFYLQQTFKLLKEFDEYESPNAGRTAAAHCAKSIERSSSNL